MLAAVARAVSAWAGQRRVLLALESHGRDALFEDVDLSRTVGWFTSLYPLAIDVRGEGDAALLAGVKQQLRAVPHRGAGFGILRYSRGGDLSAALAGAPVPDISFNYLGQFGAAAAGAMFTPAPGPLGAINSPRMLRPNLLEVSAFIAGDLRITVHYNEALHRRATISNLANAMASAVTALVAHCRTVEPAALTPADFPEANVSQDDLDRLLEQLGQAGSYS
jgi:non-ribosomal peptide synthase protein (TIGR01720 family)